MAISILPGTYGIADWEKEQVLLHLVVNLYALVFMSVLQVHGLRNIKPAKENLFRSQRDCENNYAHNNNSLINVNLFLLGFC